MHIFLKFLYYLYKIKNLTSILKFILPNEYWFLWNSFLGKLCHYFNDVIVAADGLQSLLLKLFSEQLNLAGKIHGDLHLFTYSSDRYLLNMYSLLVVLISRLMKIKIKQHDPCLYHVHNLLILFFGNHQKLNLVKVKDVSEYHFSEKVLRHKEVFLTS